MDRLSILSWNVRGLSSYHNRNNVRQFVQKFKPVVVCLQETLTSGINDRVKLSMGVFDTSCWTEMLPVGQSGGIVTFWNPSFVTVYNTLGGRNWLLICGKLLVDNQSFTIFLHLCTPTYH